MKGPNPASSAKAVEPAGASPVASVVCIATIRFSRRGRIIVAEQLCELGLQTSNAPAINLVSSFSRRKTWTLSGKFGREKLPTF